MKLGVVMRLTVAVLIHLAKVFKWCQTRCLVAAGKLIAAHLRRREA